MISQKHFTAAVVAFTTWGFFSLALKPLAEHSSLLILFYRIFGACALVFLINVAFRRKQFKESYTLFKQESTAYRRRFFITQALSAALLLSNWLIFIYTVNQINVMAVSFAYLICPITTNFLAYFILKDKMKPVQWLALSLSVIACILMTLSGEGHLLFSMVIALTYSLFLITQKFSSGIDSFLTLQVQLMFMCLFCLPMSFFLDLSIPQDTHFLPLIGLIIAAFTIFPLLLNIYALKGLKSGVVGILIYINPTINFLLAYFYFHESKTSTQFIAFGIILLSILVYNLDHFKLKKVKS